MILVIGGRSKIGSAMIDALRARGEAVRALVRQQEADAALPARVETVVGDLNSPESLRTAMSGADKAFLLSSPHRDAVDWHRNAIDAAREPIVCADDVRAVLTTPLWSAEVRTASRRASAAGRR